MTSPTNSDQVSPFDFFSLRDFSSPFQEEKEIEEPDELPENNNEIKIEEAPPPEITFSEAQLEAAKKAAKDQGYQEGLQAASEMDGAEIKKQNEQLAIMLDKISAQLGMMKAEYDEYISSMIPQMQALSIYISQVVTTNELKESSCQAIENMLKSCLPHLLNEPNLQLITSNSSAESIKNNLGAIKADNAFTSKIEIKTDDNIQTGEAKLVWDGGSASIDTAIAWQEIKERILDKSYHHLLDDSSSSKQHNCDIGESEDKENAEPIIENPENTDEV